MRKGITITSLIIYVILFFTLTILATSISTNFNRNTLQEKATIDINENIIKLQSNMLDSGKNSLNISTNNNTIIFSNGDIYKLDTDRNAILKNNGVLCENVKKFEIIDINTITENEIQDSKLVALKVEFEKFDITYSRQIVISAGDEIYE